MTDRPTQEDLDVPPAGWTQIEARAFNAVQPALTKAGRWLPLSVRKAVAMAVLAELKRELDAFAEYENAINWMTTCTSCARMLDASHRELERAEAAEELLRRYVDLAAVTHKYPITGGHDCLGENHSCAGCALAKQAQEHLERDR
ncbi:hypothetical protein [Streptomyces tendae]|uniref:hypothetical protein n=1 Tax=Streptomyces tendae TaxID=1932 RepID=UPI0038001273